jgi:excisionase family DNA binding protein
MAQLSVREAAAELGVHPARITQWIASGKIRAEWVDGPHGRMRLIDDDALIAMRRELRLLEPRESAAIHDESAHVDPDADPEPLVRARAVESYTAGLAATAIAPAVSRLVETIERLIRENGDLREEIGALKASAEKEVRAQDQVPEEEPEAAPNRASAGLADEEWDTLRERLDRLSAPASTAPSTPSKDSSRPPARRPRRRTGWGRMVTWLREVRL